MKLNLKQRDQEEIPVLVTNFCKSSWPAFVGLEDFFHLLIFPSIPHLTT